MNILDFSENIKFVGVDDREIDLFEGQYKVPDGISYNSFVIFDEKIAVTDSVDAHKVSEWLQNIENALQGKTPDYLIVHHLEPDHAGGFLEFIKKYPNATIAASAKALAFIPQFVKLPEGTKTLTLKDGDTLSLGKHTLKFIAAPMVHWPEVLLSYDESEMALFSADAFGTFGLSGKLGEDWVSEARRYYINIVGKYGMQVQNVLKKLAGIEVKTICPLHGPVLTDNLSFYIGKYNTWSSYTPETQGVFVAYAGVYGHTAEAAKKLAESLREKGVDDNYGFGTHVFFGDCRTGIPLQPSRRMRNNARCRALPRCRKVPHAHQGEKLLRPQSGHCRKRHLGTDGRKENARDSRHAQERDILRNDGLTQVRT